MKHSYKKRILKFSIVLTFLNMSGCVFTGNSTTMPSITYSLRENTVQTNPCIICNDKGVFYVVKDKIYEEDGSRILLQAADYVKTPTITNDAIYYRSNRDEDTVYYYDFQDGSTKIMTETSLKESKGLELDEIYQSYALEPGVISSRGLAEKYQDATIVLDENYLRVNGDKICARSSLFVEKKNYQGKECVLECNNTFGDEDMIYFVISYQEVGKDTQMIHVYEELVAVNLESGEITQIYGVDGEKERILYYQGESKLIYVYQKESQAFVEIAMKDQSQRKMVNLEGVDYRSTIVVSRVEDEMYYLVVGKENTISYSGHWSIQ